MNCRLAVFLIAVLLALAGDATAAPRSFSLGSAGSIEIDVPSDWSASVEEPGSASGPAILLTPARQIPFLLLVTPIPGPPDVEELRRAVRETAESTLARMREVAVEKNLALRHLQGPQCRGFYVSATDRTVTDPMPGEFKYADQGVAAVGRLMVTFTLLTNVEDAPERARALEVVRSARHVLPAPSTNGPQGAVALAYPGKTWKLVLDLPGYNTGPVRARGDGLGVRFAGEHPETGMLVTVFLEPSPSDWTAADHRERAWKRMQKTNPMKRKRVRRFERDSMAVLEFTIPSYQGIEVDQRNVNAYLVRDGVWIDVHLSKAQFRADDEQLFKSVLDSIRFVE